jgi:long-chain fatty acid transport protein
LNTFAITAQKILFQEKAMRNSLLAFLAVILLFPAQAYPGGFLIYNHDAAASAMGLAYTAQVQNPSAVLYNPAAINQLKGAQVSWGGTMILSDASFRSDSSGNKTDQDSHLFILPTFFATKQLNERWSFGIGSFSPYGLTSNWPREWEGRYQATFAQLRSFFINPVISCQVTPALSLAGGVSPVYSDVLQRKNFKIIPGRDGQATFHGKDFGWGYNLGLLYRISDCWKFGIAYRSTVRLDYDGRVSFRAPKLLQKIVPEGDASININLPGFITTGLCYSPDTRWTIEFDVYWIDWSKYDRLKLNYSQPVPAIMKKDAAPIIRDYHDTFDFCFGISYKATEAITLRAGYLFDESPVPEPSEDPILYDSDKNIYTMGLGYKTGKWMFDVANYLCFYKDRNVRNNRDGFNGKFKAFVNMLALSVTYQL